MGEDIWEGYRAGNLDATGIKIVVSLKMLKNLIRKKEIF